MNSSSEQAPGSVFARDYEALATRAIEAIDALGDHPSRAERMEAVADLLWDALSPCGMSWGGFYFHKADDPANLWLGPRRDKPACTPIGLHGACGQSFLSGEPLIVRDVADLGENYIACDPRDRSEVVVPLFEEAEGGRQVWGVLDLDSHEVACFDESDAEGLRDVLLAAGLTC